MFWMFRATNSAHCACEIFKDPQGASKCWMICWTEQHTQGAAISQKYPTLRYVTKRACAPSIGMFLMAASGGWRADFSRTFEGRLAEQHASFFLHFRRPLLMLRQDRQHTLTIESLTGGSAD